MRRRAKAPQNHLNHTSTASVAMSRITTGRWRWAALMIDLWAAMHARIFVRSSAQQPQTAHMHDAPPVRNAAASWLHHTGNTNKINEL